jgi:hypothetical protein
LLIATIFNPPQKNQSTLFDFFICPGYGNRTPVGTTPDKADKEAEDCVLSVAELRQKHISA